MAGNSTRSKGGGVRYRGLVLKFRSTGKRSKTSTNSRSANKAAYHLSSIPEDSDISDTRNGDMRNGDMRKGSHSKSSNISGLQLLLNRNKAFINSSSKKTTRNARKGGVTNSRRAFHRNMKRRDAIRLQSMSTWDSSTASPPPLNVTSTPTTSESYTTRRSATKPRLSTRPPRDRSNNNNNTSERLQLYDTGTVYTRARCCSCGQVEANRPSRYQASFLGTGAPRAKPTVANGNRKRKQTRRRIATVARSGIGCPNVKPVKYAAKYVSPYSYNDNRTSKLRKSSRVGGGGGSMERNGRSEGEVGGGKRVAVKWFREKAKETIPKVSRKSEMRCQPDAPPTRINHAHRDVERVADEDEPEEAGGDEDSILFQVSEQEWRYIEEFIAFLRAN